MFPNLIFRVGNDQANLFIIKAEKENYLNLFESKSITKCKMCKKNLCNGVLKPCKHNVACISCS